MDGDRCAGIARYFNDLEDPRMDRTRRHNLTDMIFIAICAVICGADGWVQVELFGKSKLPWFRTFLDLPHGIPSHDTFGRVFSRLDPDQFERCFSRWIAALADLKDGRLVAVDGKTLRRSLDRAGSKAAIHMVSAWCQTNQTVLGQVACEAKENEITAMPALLKLLDLRGAVVTADAMHCQRKFARQIVRAGGDYILQVKDNQPQLHEDLRLLFAEGLGDDCQHVSFETAETVNGGHGRIETRRCRLVHGANWLADDWAGIASVGCVERTRQVGQDVSTERHYYISSLGKATDAASFLAKTRGHWGVENGLHWTLDVQFREDDRRIRRGHGAENFSRLSRIALNLLKADKTLKVGIKSKRLNAGWDHDYLLHLLTQGH
jgi:predicted transposase YbfD/YdcC